MGNSDDKKIALLKVLQELEIPVNIHEILKNLPQSCRRGFAERSVRRWLNELVRENLIEKTGQKRSTCYCIPIPTRFKEESDRTFSEESEKVLTKIRRPVFNRDPVPYQDQFLESYKPNHTYYLPLKIRAELLKAGQRSQSADPAGTYAHRIFNRLLIDLSYNSSRLEGNTYSLLDTEKLVIEGKGAEGKSDEEKIMILNHKEAIRYLVDSAAKIKISMETICTLHFLLSDILLEKEYVGTIRNHAVRIGGSTYIPYSNRLKLSKLLGLIAKKAALIHDPYEQSFFLLIHLSYLQAFSDVNKRTARLSANIPLIKNNLVPLSFIDVEKDDYTTAMIAVYELQDLQPMIDLYVFSYQRTCVLYDSTIQSFTVDIKRALYRKERRQVLAKIILTKKKGPAVVKYIMTQAQKMIPQKDRLNFIEDTKEELAALDTIRIAGLGVTAEELNSWKNISK